MKKVYVVTDTVEDSFAGSSTTVVGVFSTLEKATQSVVKYKKDYIEKSEDRENPTELEDELDACVEITETTFDA